MLRVLREIVLRQTPWVPDGANNQRPSYICHHYHHGLLCARLTVRCAEVTACASVGCVNVSPDGLGTRALAGDKKKQG